MKHFRSVLIALCLSVLSGAAFGQCSGQFATNTFCGYTGGGRGLPAPVVINPGSLNPIAGGTVIGNPNSVTAIPQATPNPVLGIPTTSTGTLGLAGATSGTAIITPQAASGSPTITLPNTSGTLANGASLPLALSATTGNLTLNFDSNFALVGNNLALSSIASGNILGNSTAGSAEPTSTTLTATIDRAISGTQGTMLYRNAASWVGLAPGTAGLPLVSGGAGANLSYAILGLSAGGTNANLTASNGGIFYSTGSAAAILSGTATAGQFLRSGSSAAPTWTTTTFPATAPAGTVLGALTTNTVTATANPVLGAVGTTGTIGLSGTTSGTATITPQATAGTPTLTLPNTSGTFAVSVATPLTLSATTGAVTWTGTSGGLVYFNSTTTAASSALLAANQLVLGGGAGTAPATLGSLGTTTTVLHGNAAGAPSFGAVALATDTSGTLPAGSLPAFGSGDVSFASGGGAGTIAASAVTNAKLANMNANTIKGNNTGGAAAPSDLTVVQVSAMFTKPTRQSFCETASQCQSTTLSGTYTTPANATWLLVTMCGGGGGGAGSGTTPAAAGAGGNSTFGSSFLTANGGALGPTSGIASGGTATGGDINVAGQPGGNASGVANTQGGTGGSSWMGSGGNTNFQTGALVGVAGAGFGAGGSGANAGGTVNSGGGGGGGGCLQKLIAGPLASYAYTVGAHGTAGGAGGSGAAGAVGTTGYLDVIEHYNFLLKRDLNPANDNSPMWLDAVA